MAIYNIIYTSPQKETYLWNGSSFDLLKNKDNAGLFFSGSNIEDKKLASVLKKARAFAGKQFPDDKAARISEVEIAVNDKDTEGGHSGHMTS
ncbi:MAG: hypothetical protein ACHQHN_00225 [Sphingobacteriales bacterium]